MKRDPAATALADADPAEARSVTTTTNYNTSPDQFEKVIRPLPEDQQDVLRWWYFLGKDNGWSLSQLAQACGSSTSTLSRVFRGDYNAELTKLCGELAKARARRSERVDNPEFTQTSLADIVFALCDSARSLRTVIIAMGEMGIGKTTCELEYKRRNNHGKTIYYRCEPGMTLVQFIQSLGAACGVGYKSRVTQLKIREKLYTLLGAGQRLLIIDELHELFLRRDKNDITPILQCEFLRTCFDKAEETGGGCGLILFGTKTLEKHMATAGDALAQLVDRGEKVDLPAKPSNEDGRKIVAQFGLPPLTASDTEASAIIADILRSSGLRKLTLNLRNGATYAKKLKQDYCWRHFVTAHDDRRSLGKPRKS